MDTFVTTTPAIAAKEVPSADLSFFQECSRFSREAGYKMLAKQIGHLENGVSVKVFVLGMGQGSDIRQVTHELGALMKRKVVTSVTYLDTEDCSSNFSRVCTRIEMEDGPSPALANQRFEQADYTTYDFGTNPFVVVANFTLGLSEPFLVRVLASEFCLSYAILEMDLASLSHYETQKGFRVLYGGDNVYEVVLNSTVGGINVFGPERALTPGEDYPPYAQSGPWSCKDYTFTANVNRDHHSVHLSSLVLAESLVLHFGSRISKLAITNTVPHSLSHRSNLGAVAVMLGTTLHAAQFRQSLQSPGFVRKPYGICMLQAMTERARRTYEKAQAIVLADPPEEKKAVDPGMQGASAEVHISGFHAGDLMNSICLTFTEAKWETEPTTAVPHCTIGFCRAGFPPEVLERLQTELGKILSERSSPRASWTLTRWGPCSDRVGGDLLDIWTRLRSLLKDIFPKDENDRACHIAMRLPAGSVQRTEGVVSIPEFYLPAISAKAVNERMTKKGTRKVRQYGFAWHSRGVPCSKIEDVPTEYQPLVELMRQKVAASVKNPEMSRLVDPNAKLNFLIGEGNLDYHQDDDEAFFPEVFGWVATGTGVLSFAKTKNAPAPVLVLPSNMGSAYYFHGRAFKTLMHRVHDTKDRVSITIRAVKPVKASGGHDNMKNVVGLVYHVHECGTCDNNFEETHAYTSVRQIPSCRKHGAPRCPYKRAMETTPAPDLSTRPIHDPNHLHEILLDNGKKQRHTHTCGCGRDYHHAHIKRDAAGQKAYASKHPDSVRCKFCNDRINNK